MANIGERVREALKVFRSGYPWQRQGMGSKGAPFMMWPRYWDGEPQWRMIDLKSYLEEGFNANTLIYSAVMAKGRASMQAPLRAFDGAGEQAGFLQMEHPLSRLCRRPNPSQSWREFQLAQTIFLNITGDAFTWFDRQGSEMGVPRAMYSLNPMRTFVVPGEKGQVRGYWYTPEGRGMADGYPLLAEDVSHVKLPNPNDPLDGEGYGLSPLAPLAQSADVDNMITRFLNLFFQRGAAPVGVLRFERGLDPATVGNIKARWREMYGGYENWTEVGVLDSGGEYQRIGMTFEELGFEALDERNESRILGPFGVPPILVGSRLGLMRSTYANYKEAREGFWEDTMRPEMLLFEDDYRYYLKSEDGGTVGFDFAMVPALRKDVNQLVMAWDVLVRNGIDGEHAARVVGLNLGKVTQSENGVGTMGGEHGGEVYLPGVGVLGVKEITNHDPVLRTAHEIHEKRILQDGQDGQDGGKENSNRKGAKGAKEERFNGDGQDGRGLEGLGDGQDGGNRGDGEAGQGSLAKNAKFAKGTIFTEEERKGIWEAVDKGARKWEGRFAEGARRALGNDWREILALVGEEKRRAQAVKASVNWRRVLDDVRDYLEVEGAEFWRSTFAPLIEGVVTEQGRRWAGRLGLQFDVQNLLGREWLNRYEIQFAQPINQTTEREIAQILAEAEATGASIPQVQGQLEALFTRYITGELPGADFEWFLDRLPPYRTEWIARTETMRASNAGTVEQFKDWGVRRKEWLSTQDERTREEHRAAEVDGQVVGIEEAFSVGGEALLFPGDPNGSDWNVIQCRCTVLPVME